MQVRLIGWRAGLVVALLLLTPFAAAQTVPPAGDLLDQRLLHAVQRPAQALPAPGLALEGAVDPHEYIVGPGDQFTLAVGGALAQEFRSTVSADGYLTFAEVGRFQVAGRTLAAVRELLQAPIRRIYRNVAAELVLSQPRRFYVHVSGAVAQPGRHVVGPVARAEDAVRAAMDGDNPLQLLARLERQRAARGPTVAYPALRNIRVHHTDGSTSSVDLRSYYATGDRHHNPFLRDGDVVVVPAFDPLRDAVFVDGAPLGPGVYDFRPGDTVGALLALATGTHDAPNGPIRLVRADGAATEFGPGPNLAAALATELRPGDRLILAPAAPDLGTVVVDGRVRFPGEYPIRSGQTTVGELIAMAGGLREDALANAAFLERRGATRPHVAGTGEDAHRGAAEDEPEGRPLGPLEAERRLHEEAFGALRLADLDFASRQYLLNELRRTPRMPLDVRGNPHAPDLNVTLRDGDRLVVPQDQGGIFVFGQVVRSGFIPFAPNLTVSDYIEQAGGRTSAARGVYVRKAGSGLLLAVTDNDVVEPGDAVFVDRRAAEDTEMSRQLALQEQQLRVQTQQQWMHVASALLGSATALVTALILTRR